MKELKVDNLYVTLAGNSRRRIVYILSPTRGVLDEWTSGAAARYDVTIAVVTGMDWDNDLTPWPAPGVPRGEAPFAGHASVFLSGLCGRVIPEVESGLGLDPDVKRDLVGISLSGLFALWQWVLCDEFADIACLSGSFWYKDFAQWITRLTLPSKGGRAVLLLGNKEHMSVISEFRCVAAATAAVVEALRGAGIDTEYKTVPGNHYQHGLERLSMAFDSLYA